MANRSDEIADGIVKAVYRLLDDFARGVLRLALLFAVLAALIYSLTWLPFAVQLYHDHREVAILGGVAVAAILGTVAFIRTLAARDRTWREKKAYEQQEQRDKQRMAPFLRELEGQLQSAQQKQKAEPIEH